MDHSELLQLWASVEADLSRARGLLEKEASEDPTIKCSVEFVAHNELELACDSLADYGEEHVVPGDYWLALRDAASKMKLPGKAAEYVEHYENLKRGCEDSQT